MNARIALSVALLALASPAEAGMSVIGSLVRHAPLAPAEEATGEVLVRNTGDEPLDVIVYQQDYAFSADGRNTFADPGTLPRSNAGWVTFSPQQLRIPAGETVPVSYTITAPDDPGLAGTWWSLLVVEPMAARFDPDAQERAVGIRTVVRYAVHLATDLPGDAASDLAFADPEVGERDGARALEFTLHNRGERGGRAAVWADVFGADGAPVGRFDGDAVLTWPGCSSRGRIPLPDLAAGRYTAILVADGGDDDVFGIQLDLQVR